MLMIIIVVQQKKPKMKFPEDDFVKRSMNSDFVIEKNNMDIKLYTRNKVDRLNVLNPKISLYKNYFLILLMRACIKMRYS